MLSTRMVSDFETMIQIVGVVLIIVVMGAIIWVTLKLIERIVE